MLDRALPSNLNAERAVLGSVLLDREAILAIESTLTGDDFFVEKHAWVFEAVVSCLRQRIPPDIATVAEELRRNERLELVGGLAFLGELISETPTAVHVEYYAGIVATAAQRRRLIEAGGKITARGYEEQEELSVSLDAAEQLLGAVARRQSGDGFVTVGSVMTQLLTEAEADEVEAMPTGLSDLDARLDGGLHPGNLVLLAGRPGLGKTGCALSIAYHLGVRQGRGVGVVSLEMNTRELGWRLLAMHTGVDTRDVRRLIRTGDPRMTDAMGVIHDAPISIDDTAGQTVMDVRSRARRLSAAGKLDLLIVDYLQLLLSDAPGQNRVDEVSRVSRQLKLLAKELDCPILALSQLSRAPTMRANKVPQLSDLRDSGALEQDADVVIFIHREEHSEDTLTPPGVAELHIGKNRHGPTGMVMVAFDGPTTRFANLSAYAAPAGY